MEFLLKLVFLPAITFRIGGGRKMKKIILGVFVFAVSLFGFTGCYDAVYQSIRNEIELTTQKMPGFINNIARYNCGDEQFLFLPNGVIHYKNAKDEEHGKWIELSGNGLPDSVHYVFENTEFDGFYFSKIIADSKYVYALGFSPTYDTDNSRNVPVKLKVYYTDPTLGEDGKLQMAWKEITELSKKINEYQNEIDKIDDDNYGMAISCHLFGTNSVNPEHRVAFLRVGGGSPYLENSRNNTSSLYKLDGETLAPPVASITSDENADSGDFVYSEFDLDTLSVVYFGGKYHFMNYLNAETNEGTADSSGTVRTEPTYVYFGDFGDNLYYFSVDSYDETYKTMFKYPRASYRGRDGLKSPTDFFTENGENAGYIKNVSDSNVISIAVTSDSLILGTGSNRSYNAGASNGSGVVKINIDADTGKPTRTGSFSTNADKVMYSPYTVRALLAVNPSKTETATSIYSTMDYIYTATSAGTNSTNRGLWAYYPEKGKWNRE